MSQNKFLQLLSRFTAADIPLSKPKVVELTTGVTPNEGFQVLLENQILSAPVWDDKAKQYTGFLDMRDLVSFVVFSADQNLLVPCLSDIVSQGMKMFQQAVDSVTVTYLSKRHPIHPITESTRLDEVARLLCTFKRLPVLNGDGKAINIISQSSLLAFLDRHHKEVESELVVKINEIEIGSRGMYKVPMTASALDTFRLMEKRNLSGLAVVDQTGKLVGNTSGRDLKLFVQKQETLEQPIMQFLNKIRQESIDIKSPTISVRENETLKMVVAKLAATKIHRVFVTTPEYTPIRVVSVQDIIKYICK